MDVVDSLNDLLYNPANLRLFHPSIFSQKLQKLASRAIFDQKVNVLFVLEIAIQGRDISMSQVKLNT